MLLQERFEQVNINSFAKFALFTTAMISKVKPVVHDNLDRKEWFETWFDSPYYHILYKNRDNKEAQKFLDYLIQFINPQPNSRILDVACGRGRHSVYLNKLGFIVTGFDLSENNIEFDKQFDNETLQFYVHDMREVFRVNYYDLVLNLFSSFGYFEKDRDNERCLIANATALKPNGIFVFDYFNANKIIMSGNYSGEKTIDGIHFKINKTVEKNSVKKCIEIKDGDKTFCFEEQLILTMPEVFTSYFENAGLTITGIFGNYQLEAFDKLNSNRLIIIAKKKAI